MHGIHITWPYVYFLVDSVYTVSVTWLTQLAEDGTSGGVKRDWNLNSWSHLLANSWLRLDLPHIDFSPSSDRFVTQLSQLLANTLHTWQNPEPAALTHRHSYTRQADAWSDLLYSCHTNLYFPNPAHIVTRDVRLGPKVGKIGFK